MLKPRAVHVFATGSDMEPGLEAIQAERSLQFARKGLFKSPAIERFSSALEIPNLGIVRSGGSLERLFLVLDAAWETRSRAVPQRRGGVLYAVDEVANPPAMIFLPGGEFGEDVVVASELMATSDPRSHDLYRFFFQRFVKGFAKIKGSYVGPEAQHFLESGRRLTYDVGRPPEYDLKR